MHAHPKAGQNMQHTFFSEAKPVKLCKHYLYMSLTDYLSTIHIFFTTSNKSVNSRLNHLLGEVQDWYKSIFRMEVTEPYPQSNGGQN